ncbi:MAG: hypothetical protein NVS1B4_11400 [Gemmatimonadaceae bacterium]
MISRERILEAAARVYAKHGFRGATTRLIAAEAGVNEVTLFRTFGSKGALIAAVMQARAEAPAGSDLPDEPRDPVVELTTWCSIHIDHLREARSLIRQMMSEVEERPEAACMAGVARSRAKATLVEYVERMRSRGWADSASDVPTAVSMLTSAMFGDAMGREMMPECFPAPAESAASKYVHCFLRMIGASAAVAAPAARRAKQSRRESA